MKKTMSTKNGISGASSTFSQATSILFTWFFVRFVLLLIITTSTCAGFVSNQISLVRTLKFSIGQTSTTAIIYSKFAATTLVGGKDTFQRRTRRQISIDFPKGFIDALGGSYIRAKSTFNRNGAASYHPHWVSLSAATSIPDDSSNVEIAHSSSSTAKMKFRSLARKVTGLSLTSMRATGRAMTGFSLSALRISLRSAMSQPITSMLHWFVGLFPVWVRKKNPLFQVFLYMRMLPYL